MFATAAQLATAIRAGEVSATEVLDAHLGRITKHNPALNAIVTLDTDGAMRQAAEAEGALARGEVWGPLHGVPVTVKDAFETAGLRTTCGYKPLAQYVPKQDAMVVARLRDAGAIVLGKTNVPPLGRGLQCRNPLFGRTNNPWDLSRTPGGSTGGGAAAVAAGLSPLEVGSDGGGSVRIPAHFCGVFALKPTEDMVSTAGHIPPLPGAPRALRHMLVPGALARSVEDLRIWLSVTARPDGRPWEVPPLPSNPPPKRPLQTYRFAWTDDLGGIPVSTETRTALRTLAQTLSRAGSRVERRHCPGISFPEAWLTYGEILGFEMGASQSPRHRLVDQFQFSVFDTVQRIVLGGAPITRGWRRGLALRVPQYARALERRDQYLSALEQFLTQWDAWILPVTVGPAFTHRLDGFPLEVDGRKVPYELGVAHCAVFNLTGSPVAVIPVARSSDGLPIGVQLVGRRWGDWDLLAIAEELAEVTGSFQPPPGF